MFSSIVFRKCLKFLLFLSIRLLLLLFFFRSSFLFLQILFTLFFSVCEDNATECSWHWFGSAPFHAENERRARRLHLPSNTHTHIVHWVNMSMQSLSFASVNLILGDGEKNEEFRSFVRVRYRKSTFQNALNETELLRGIKKERKEGDRSNHWGETERWRQEGSEQRAAHK